MDDLKEATMLSRAALEVYSLGHSNRALPLPPLETLQHA